MMDFDFSKEQMLLRSAAVEFLKKECPTTLIREMKNDEKGYPPELWRKMADLGWLGILIPQEYNGIGGNFLDLAILLEAMGEYCLPGPFFSTMVLGAQSILAAGSAKHKNDLLPQIADGSMIMAMAVTEPGGRYGTACTNTQAVEQSDGYIINGTKLFVENAHIADYILCLCRTRGKGSPSRNQMTLFLVDTQDPGIQTTVLKTLAYDKQCETVFTNVRVPKENIIGEPGEGSAIANQLFELAAAAKSAEILGGIQAALNMTVKYAKARVQFGRPIGSFQTIQNYCSRMLMDVEAAKVLTYQAAWRISENMPAVKEIAMAKAWTAEASRRVISFGHQIHGALGFCEETDIHLYYRRARAGDVSFGDVENQMDKLAAEIGLCPLEGGETF